jgi:hypothetical protein
MIHRSTGDMWWNGLSGMAVFAAVQQHDVNHVRSRVRERSAEAACRHVV